MTTLAPNLGLEFFHFLHVKKDVLSEIGIELMNDDWLMISSGIFSSALHILGLTSIRDGMIFLVDEFR